MPLLILELIHNQNYVVKFGFKSEFPLKSKHGRALVDILVLKQGLHLSVKEPNLEIFSRTYGPSKVTQMTQSLNK